MILDQNGKVRLSTTPAHEGASQAREPYFVQASSGITAVQPVTNSKLTGHQTITISTPLFDQGGQEIGELAANLSLERLDGIVLESTGLGSAGQMYLVEPGKQVRRPAYAQGPVRGAVALARDGCRGSPGTGGPRALSRLSRRRGDRRVRWLPEPGTALRRRIEPGMQRSHPRGGSDSRSAASACSWSACSGSGHTSSPGGSRSRFSPSRETATAVTEGISPARPRSPRMTRSACSPRPSTP